MTLQKLFQNYRENINKNSQIRTYYKVNQEWDNVSFKNNLKVFKTKKKNEKVKTEPFFYLSYNSHFSHRKSSVLADLIYRIIFLISLLSKEMQHLKVG